MWGNTGWGVIPTFIIDWPVLILIGLIFGYGVRKPDSGFWYSLPSLFLTRAFVSGKIITGLFVLIVYYSYLLAPDWMWMYFIRGAELPGWMVWYVLALYFFAYALGFLMKFELEKLSTKSPFLMMLFMLVAEAGIIFPLKDRYLHVGTYSEFYSNLALPLPESVVGTVPGVLTGILVVIAILLLVWSRRQTFIIIKKP